MTVKKTYERPSIVKSKASLQAVTAGKLGSAAS
jgi:hypothetical protein